MKFIIYLFFFFIFLLQPGITAIEQVHNLRPPVIVIVGYSPSNKMNSSAFMTVQDGEGHYVDLHKDSTLISLIKKYKSGDTIK